MFTLVKAEDGQVARLTELSKAAFDTDIAVGSAEKGGPDGYDSEQWHCEMQKSGNLYSLLREESLIGGAILFADEKDPAVLYIGRIFIDPLDHRQGCGLALMNLIEQEFPEIRVFRLETPVWNRRTRAFYNKCGYTEKHRDAESIYFEKRRGRNELSELKPFLDRDGRLTALPAKRKKKLTALWALAGKFEPDRVYTESEINDRLDEWTCFHDPATLRREMYDSRLLDRSVDGRCYRRIEKLPTLEDYLKEQLF